MKKQPKLQQDPKKLEAAAYKLVRGEKTLRGYHAVDPSGHLVLLRPDQELPEGDWRWASAADLKAKAELAQPKLEK